MKEPKTYLGRYPEEYALWLIYIVVLGTSLAVALGGCCSPTPVKKHDCYKDDGPAYCRARELPGANRR